MGSVRDLYTTGDNDPEIEPVQYYRHYLYCDACGSFELDPWTAPGEVERVERKRHRLAMAALGSLLAIPILWLADVGDVLPPWLMLVGGALLIVGFLAARGLVDSSGVYLGLRCRRCEATYGYGTPFFSDLDANPRHLAVADVPRPLGSSPFQRGESVA